MIDWHWAKNEKGSPFFDIEIINEICDKNGWDWHHLNVVSRNSVGKSTWMINTFLNREKVGKLTSFAVRKAEKDPAKPISWLETKGRYRWHKDKFHILKAEIETLIKTSKTGIQNEKIITNWNKKGYILPLWYSGDIKGRKIDDCDLLFYDDVANINKFYLTDEKKSFKIVAGVLARINPNFKAITFSNTDDLNVWSNKLDIGLEVVYNKNGIKISKYKHSNKVVVNWNYIAPKKFRNEIAKDTVFELYGQTDVEFNNIAVKNKGNKSSIDTLYIEKNINSAKHIKNYQINNIKFGLYKAGKFYIFGDFLENKKKEKLTIKSLLFRNYQKWHSQKIIKFQTNEWMEKIEKIVKEINTRKLVK